MSYRLAKSLETLRGQVDASAPNRSKISDGWIGDADHASRTSDHNPWVPPPEGGVVTAIDLTHDPRNGADMVGIAETLRESKDSRIKYVIFQGRMFSSYASSGYDAWTWRPYSGVNAHAAHMHVSVQPSGYDSTRKWSIGGKDWFDMATESDLRKIVREEVKKALEKDRRLLAVGEDRPYKPANVNIKKAIKS